MGSFLVVASVSVSIALGVVITRGLLSLMLSVIPLISGIRGPGAD